MVSECLEEFFGEQNTVSKHSGIAWELISLDILSGVKLQWVLGASEFCLNRAKGFWCQA